GVMSPVSAMRSTPLRRSASTSCSAATSAPVPMCRSDRCASRYATQPPFHGLPNRADASPVQSQQRESFEEKMGAQQRREVRVVERGADFHQVHADQPQSGESAQKL